MTVAVLRERISGERRVAVTPESAKQLVALGLAVVVEAVDHVGSIFEFVVDGRLVSGVHILAPQCHPAYSPHRVR